jgi:hypothetical protein
MNILQYVLVYGDEHLTMKTNTNFHIIYQCNIIYINNNDINKTKYHNIYIFKGQN